MTHLLLITLFLTTTILLSAQERNTREFLGLGLAPDQAAAKLGEPLYADNCAACHGKNARGAQGPNLLRSPLVLHDEKGEAISIVIKNGRPQSGMPAFSNLTIVEAYDIAEFIHLQIELAANRGTYRDQYADSRNHATGNPQQGQKFFIANCASCHSIAGDLAGVGNKYPQAAVMITKIAWPASFTPKQATVTTASGNTITGMLLKQDDFDVELQDSDGGLHFWTRNEITLNVPDKLAGHRALLPKYTDADLHNLTAYMVTIK